MASTARTDAEKVEIFDSPEVLKRKVDILAQWIRGSKHCIAFTGAGISTSAGIPDFRSGMNTSLNTGPGVWELQAKREMRNPKYHTTSSLKAIPTITHMSFVKLQKEGILKCVISQNTDGLHRRSGLPKNALCELHGNTNLETCNKCGREYLRDYRTRTAQGIFQHLTGRNCDDPECRGRLRDTIINFGENLPELELLKSFDEAEVADLCLAMGSSLTVTPAATIPERVALRHQHLVIVNLQRTPLDDLAALRINGKCDDVIKMLMETIQMEIPEFRMRRQLVLKSVLDGNTSGVTVEGKDTEGHPFSFIKEVEMVSVGGKEIPVGALSVSKDGFTYYIPWNGEEGKEPVKLRVHFHGHYREPPLDCEIMVNKKKSTQVRLQIEYNPFNGEWTKTPLDQLTEQLATASLS